MMELRIALKRNTVDVPPSDLRECDPNIDSLTGLLADLCEGLADRDAVEFCVGGFGQERWPVDVVTDLPVVLEQLPMLAGALAEMREAELEFYEQGVERTLVFHPVGDEIRVTCSSQTSWQPVPRAIVERRAKILQMLADVCLAFWSAVTPSARSHPWLQEWKRKTDVLRRPFN